MPENTSQLRLVNARAAHVMLGDGLTGTGIVVGFDPVHNCLAAARLQDDDTIGEPLTHDSLSAALCQWDDSRSLFVLDAQGRVYDDNVPMNDDDTQYSWEDLTRLVFDNSRIPKSDVIRDAMFKNLVNLSETVGMQEAMFYLTAVAYDVDTAVTVTDRKKVTERMVADYSMVDPEQEALDAVEAASCKAYGGLHMYDLGFTRLAGSWVDWEAMLKRLRLPSSMWLPLRRATGILGKIDRNILTRIVHLFTPYSEVGDVTRMAMIEVPPSCVEDWLLTMRSWVEPDEQGTWADLTRFEWVTEYVELTRMILDNENAWSTIEPTDQWSLETIDELHALQEMNQDEQITWLSQTWARVLQEVFYPAVDKTASTSDTVYGFDELEETMIGIQSSIIDLHARVLAFVSILPDTTIEHNQFDVTQAQDDETKDNLTPEELDSSNNTESDATTEQVVTDDETINTVKRDTKCSKRKKSKRKNTDVECEPPVNRKSSQVLSHKSTSGTPQDDALGVTTDAQDDTTPDNEGIEQSKHTIGLKTIKRGETHEHGDSQQPHVPLPRVLRDLSVNDDEDMIDYTELIIG